MAHRTRYVLAISFFFVATIPVLLLGAWVERTTKRNEIAAVAEKHLLVAQSLTEVLDRYVAEARSTFEIYVANRSSSGVAGISLLAERLGFSHFLTLENDGTISSALSVTESPPDRISDALLANIKEHATRGLTVFTPVQLDTSGKPAIFLVHGLEDGRIAVGTLHTGYISRLQRTVQFGRRGHAVIVDQNGNVVAHPYAQNEGKIINLASVPPVSRMRNGGTGVMTFHSPITGEEMIAGYTSAGESGWGVMVPQPISELFERAREVLVAAGTIIIGGLAAAAVLSWWIAGLFLRPVTAVVQAAGAIASGEADARAVLPRRWVPREFRQLGDSFNRMAEHIQDQQRELARRAEQERREALSGIASNIPGLIFRRVRESSGPSTFELVSAGEKNEFDLDMSTLQNNLDRFETIVHPEDLPELERSFEASSETLDRQLHEFRIVGRSGGVRWGRAVSHPNAQQDGRIVWDGIVFDITDHRNAEHELRLARDAAQQASQAKTAFLANMSHELRTPLNAIIGFSEMMKMRLFGSLPERYAGYAADINSSAHYLLSLINDLLDLSKVESGKWELDERVIPVCETVLETCNLLKEDFQRRGLDLHTQIAPQLPELIADRRKLQQMLINVLGNSMKFTDGGGTVTVSANLSPDGSLEIAVADTGIGIAEEDLEKVMLPFSQASPEQDGTGLGLALVKSFIELHDGRVEIESKLHMGTTVTLRFPVERVVRLAA